MTSEQLCGKCKKSKPHNDTHFGTCQGEEQVGERPRVWFSSIAKNDIGEDIENLVIDINAFEGTSRTQGTTWARGKGRVDKRRADNTRGSIRECEIQKATGPTKMTAQKVVYQRI
ncbi:hypothetical protein BKA70DRAFT_1221761 [Coprinopsis sp. MPI-PUGE-AT-0042]|nr:hypothetical protein BKA70DRAFT_1221761 [Coprinopsis sp. MPI-PUGE-AT-0042]